MKSVEPNAIDSPDPALLFKSHLINDTRFEPCMSKYEITSYLTMYGNKRVLWREATIKIFNGGLYVLIENKNLLGLSLLDRYTNPHTLVGQRY